MVAYVVALQAFVMAEKIGSKKMLEKHKINFRCNY